MNKEHENQLFLRFHDIFSEAKEQSEDRIYPFYFECDDGWFKLIWDLCEEIEKISLAEDGPCPKVRQVKEKFGGLRFYVHSASTEMRAQIKNAEERSYTICEDCGAPGRLVVKKGYYMTRCTQHTPEGAYEPEVSQ